jgi:hypothetical protein
MTQAVILLGAGSSAPFGVPTLRHLFKDPYARQHLKGDQRLLSTLDKVFWAPRGHTLESSHHSLTAEELLTILRDYENFKEIPAPLVGEELEEFRRSLYVLIKKAVFDGKSSDGRFLNRLITLAEERFGSVTWASFNWDCIFEASFYYAGHTPTRSNPEVIVKLENWRNPPSKHRFLKLHGGVNWWYDGANLIYLPFGRQPDLQQCWARYEAGEDIGKPVILEPSYYKYLDEVYPLLRPQWDYFVKSLIGADLVLVLGYSLPEADIMARTALMIGFQSGKPNARWVIVDKSPDVCGRYQRLLGTARVKALAMDIEEFNEDIPGNLNP